MIDLKEIAERKIDGLLLSHGPVGVVLTVAERDALLAALRDAGQELKRLGVPWDCLLLDHGIVDTAQQEER